MKKRLFDIDSDEVLRILSLHEERTKNQYLNIINEEGGNVSNPDYGKSSGGNVQPKPKINPLQSWTVNSASYSLENAAGGTANNELKIFKGVKFVQKINKQGKPYLITQATNVQLPDTVSGKINGKATASVIYNCATGKFSLTNVKNITMPSSQFQDKTQRWYDEERYLTAQLTKVCQYKAPKQELPVKDANAGKVADVKAGGKQGGQSGQGSGQFTQDVVNTNTQIQTSLGIQTPTGQITDADIDAILAKLG